MIDVTLTINGRDLSQRLSTFMVEKEPFIHGGVVTTMDGAEHFGARRDRSIIRFSLIPATEEDEKLDYDALSANVLRVTFTDPCYAEDRPDVLFRVNSNLALAYGLRSVDGNRYYKGGEIELRALYVD